MNLAKTQSFNLNQKVLTWRGHFLSTIELHCLKSTSLPSCSLTPSRQNGPPNPKTPPLDYALGYDKAFVTDASSEALVFAGLCNLEHSRSFLLEYLNPDLLFFFLASLDEINPLPSFIYSKIFCEHEAIQNMSLNHERSFICS